MTRNISLLLAAFILAACAAPSAPPSESVSDFDVTPPPAVTPIPEPDWAFVAGLDPDTILVQMEYEPTYADPREFSPYGRVPEFTLYADGRVYYLFADPQTFKRNLFTATLSPDAVVALLSDLWAAGYGTFDTYTGDCKLPEGGLQECIADASTLVLRVQIDPDTQRETRNYASYAPYRPDELQAVREFLEDYGHPLATLAVPHRAAMWVTANAVSPEQVPSSDWPLDPALLDPPANATDYDQPENSPRWGIPIDRDQVSELMNVIGGNYSGAFFTLDGDLFYVELTPWLPTEDYDEIVYD